MSLQVISRKKAKERGLLRYYTGTPCLNGHLAERLVSTCHCCCRMCRYLKWRLHYDNNADQIAARQARYRVEHRDQISAVKARYHAKHRDRHLRQFARYHAKHRDQILAKSRERERKKAIALLMVQELGVQL
jgi:hypothetical protein